MEFTRKKPLIILVAGRAGHGKSTLAKYLETIYIKSGKKVVVSPYTKYLKRILEDIMYMKMDDNNKPRDLLQQVSSKIIKEKLGYQDFFIRRQIEDIEIYSYFTDIIIVPDVRFPEEITIIKNKFPNVISIGIKRVDYISNLTIEQQQDITEVSLDNYHEYDYKVINNNDTSLKEKAIEIIESINTRSDINE